MKTLYINCSMGAAGDMLTGALIELMPDRIAAVGKLNSLVIPGVEFSAEDSEKCGITGTHIRVLVDGDEELPDGHTHEHQHCHEHTHEDGVMHSHEHEHIHGHGHHHHNGMHDIEHIIMDHIDADEKVRRDALAVYEIVADAESKAHGVPVTEVHFHEVGAMDAVADVAAACFLMNELGPDRVIVSDIHVGNGTVNCAHGVLPVPAPATANILEDLPYYKGDIDSELCTPTGAALLRYFGTEFGANMAEIEAEYAASETSQGIAAGRGMGNKDFARPNCVTVYFKES